MAPLRAASSSRDFTVNPVCVVPLKPLDVENRLGCAACRESRERCEEQDQ